MALNVVFSFNMTLESKFDLWHLITPSNENAHTCKATIYRN